MWTEHKIARLSKLWTNGQSASLIAHDLGVTRNAVISKVHRLKLGERKTLDSLPRPPRGPRPPRNYRPSRLNLETISFRQSFTMRAPSREPTKTELRNILAEAVRNTATLPVS